MFGYRKNFMCSAKKIKKFEFWRASFGRTSIFKPPIFVMFSLCLAYTYSKNLIHLAATI